MAREKKVSDFKNYVTAGRMSKFSAGLVNYFITFILSFIFYIVGAIPICENTPVINQSKRDYNDSYWNLTEIVNQTKLQTSYENRLLTMDEMAKTYYQKLTVSTFKNLGLEETPLSKVKTTDENCLKFENDGPAYYYLKFRYEKGIAENVSDSQKLEYYYNQYKVKNELFEKYFVVRNVQELTISDYQMYLKEEYAKEMDLYLNNSTNISTSKQEEIFNDLNSIYNYVAGSGINEVEQKYQTYLAEKEKYDIAYNKYTTIMTIAMIITFSIFFVLFDVVPSLFYKNKETVGEKVFKVVTISRDGTKPTWWQITIKRILEYVSGFSSLVLVPIFTNGYALYGTALIGPINFLTILIFTLIILLLSVILMLVMPNRQYLSDLASLQISKSTKFVETEREDKASDFRR